MGKYTVRGPNGEVYPGVIANSPEEAVQKMTAGPQGILRPNGTGEQQAGGQSGEKPAQGLEGLTQGRGLPLSPEASMTPKTMFENPTGKDVAKAAVPAVMGLFPQGRTFGRAVLQILGNILGSAGVEGGAEMMKPPEERDMETALLQGGTQGILPGLVSAAGGAIMGPNKATIKAEKALNILKEGDISPNVAGALNAENPASLYSRGTLRKMQNEAGTNLDAMEDVVGKALGPATFTLPSKSMTYMGVKTGIGFPKTFTQIRDEIKQLRDLGERPYSQGPLGVTSEQARAAQSEARQLSKDLVSEMRKQGFGKWADIYEEATSQYAKDKEAIRYVQAKQKQRALPGGATPEDRPDLAKAEGVLAGTTPSIPHGVIGVTEAATGRPMGAFYHLGRFMDSLTGARGKVAESMPGRFSPSRAVGPLGGAGASYLQNQNFMSTGE